MPKSQQTILSVMDLIRIYRYAKDVSEANIQALKNRYEDLKKRSQAVKKNEDNEPFSPFDDSAEQVLKRLELEEHNLDTQSIVVVSTQNSISRMEKVFEAMKIKIGSHRISDKGEILGLDIPEESRGKRVRLNLTRKTR